MTTRPPHARTTIRRSFALPARLVEQVAEAAPPEYRNNLNAVVRLALEEYVRSRDRRMFEDEMDRMAADPQIRAAIQENFRAMEGLDDQGLPPS